MSDLTVWARDHYDVFKDFAGPVATVIASVAAAIVAYTLGRGQRRITELQADIADRAWKTANDKVVLELFQPRLAIYDAIRVVVFKAHTGKPSPNELYFEFGQAVERAPFYFNDDVAAYLEKLRHLIIDIEEVNTIMSDTANADYHRATQQRYQLMMEVRKFYTEAPVVFRPYIQAYQKA